MVVVENEHESSIHRRTETNREPTIARRAGPCDGNIEICGSGSRVLIWHNRHAEVERECIILLAELDRFGIGVIGKGCETQ